jgi:hypothetical protein
MLPPLPEELLALILEDFALPIHDLDCPAGQVRNKRRGRQRRCQTTLGNACLHRVAWPNSIDNSATKLIFV